MALGTTRTRGHVRRWHAKGSVRNTDPSTGVTRCEPAHNRLISNCVQVVYTLFNRIGKAHQRASMYGTDGRRPRDRRTRDRLCRGRDGLRWRRGRAAGGPTMMEDRPPVALGRARCRGDNHRLDGSRVSDFRADGSRAGAPGSTSLGPTVHRRILPGSIPHCWIDTPRSLRGLRPPPRVGAHPRVPEATPNEAEAPLKIPVTNLGGSAGRDANRVQEFTAARPSPQRP